MAMTAEQFDIYIKDKTNELTQAWQAFPPTEIEVMAKAIIDYQYNATTAILNSINVMNQANHNRFTQMMEKIKELEDKIV